MKHNEERYRWIDIAKCVGIIAIVLNHCSTGRLNIFCVSFNSVLFFILSGLTFCREKGDRTHFLAFDNRTWGSFLRKLAKSIVIPYFVWGGQFRNIPVDGDII